MSRLLDAPPRLRSSTNGHSRPPRPPTGGGDGPDGESPRRAAFDNVVLATMFLIAGEVMFFAGLVSAFLVLRVGAAVWPPPLQPRLPVGVTGLNTLVLIASSVAVFVAMRALRRGERRAATRSLQTAAGLGVAFLIVQGYEWLRLVHFGLTVSSSTYGATFYTLIGTHGVHVLGALLWLALMLRGLSRGRFTEGRTAPVRACAIYWHFVVTLWPFLYVLVYLI
ncbi:MAG TPA: cytochrome c oxidase subunit 3 [Methylomirabilota bacterium]